MTLFLYTIQELSGITFCQASSNDFAICVSQKSMDKTQFVICSSQKNFIQTISKMLRTLQFFNYERKCQYVFNAKLLNRTVTKKTKWHLRQ